MAGTVHLVGAGPGSADLLTLRAARLLGQAGIVLHDALVGPDVLAMAPQARLLNVGKRAGRPSASQDVINRLLVRATRHHACVVRLKGGDPMLFGRAHEELAACRAAGVAVEVVPGISAAFAAAADSGQSLTRRGVARSIAFVTPATGRGETADAGWARAAAAADGAAVYMGAGPAGATRDALLAAGLTPDTPVMLAQSAGSPDARISGGRLRDLVELAAAAGAGPALLLVGAAFEALAGQLDAPLMALRA